MKVTDLRRKLMAAVAAGGLLAPGAVQAANVDTNLVVNGDFETVDPNDPGVAMTAYNSPRILNWVSTPATSLGFAYSHNHTNNLPDFANGGPLSVGGNYYFSPHAGNNVVNNVDVTTIDVAGEFSQDIAVGAGPTGTAIAAGTAVYSLNAFFSGYEQDGDFGNVQVDFLNGTTPLGTAAINNRGLTNAWTARLGTGTVPVGTNTVRVSIFGTAFSGQPDGYLDNVDFRIGSAVHDSVLELQINRNSGAATLINHTGAAVDLEGYSITSAFQALAPANWKSIADNYDAGSPGIDQIDGTHQWTKLTLAASRDNLGEGDLATGDGAAYGNNRTVPLGNTGMWIPNPNEDLYFNYTSNGVVVPGIVNFTGNEGKPLPLGDLNADGVVTSADWIIVRTNQNSAALAAKSLAEAYRLGDFNQDHKNDHDDFVVFKTLFDNANGVGAFVAMLNSVPESSSVVMALTVGVLLIPASRRGAARN